MRDNIVLYFGSFNPIHNGHLTIANYMLDSQLCGEIWFVVSPQNPLKEQSSLIDEHLRLEMAQLGVSQWGRAIKVVDVEFSMKRPSYTISTILRLSELHPDKDFSLLIGEDNLMTFERWRRWQEIVARCTVFVYPRGSVSMNVVNDKIRELRTEGAIGVDRIRYLADAPRIDVSSTQIRDSIEDIDDMTATAVVDYIKKEKLYGRK